MAHWLLGAAARLRASRGLFSDSRDASDTVSLYRRGGPYEYTRGVNPRAIVALAAGVVVALIGLAVPALRFLYDYAWFVGFFVAAATYYLLMLRYKVDTSAPLNAVTRSGANE